jgi:uncharacterized protein involved in exopolysaccharide biosynthesis
MKSIVDHPVYTMDSAEPELAEPHLQQLLNILRRRHGMIIATVVVGTTLVFVCSLMLAPRYISKAQIVLEPQAMYLSDGRPALAQSDEEAALQTHIAGLTSRAYLERVIDSLSGDPDFRAAASWAPKKTRWIGDTLWFEFGALLRDGVARLVASRRPQDELPTDPALRLDRFERALNIYQEHGSRVISVSFTSTSPEQAALAANRLAQLYLGGEEERKRAQASRAMSWLDERIPMAKGELEQAETALQSYRTAHSLSEPVHTRIHSQNATKAL